MYNKKMKFAEWLVEFNIGTLESELVDFNPIKSLFGKSDKAVELVRAYDAAEGEHKWLKDHLKWEGPRNDFGYLLNVATVAPLSGTVYGLFNSRENQRILDPDIKRPGIKFKQKNPLTGEELNQQNFMKDLAFNVIRQKYPDVDPNKIHDSAVIHVNVPKIIQDLKLKGYSGQELDRAIVKEIASTIVHESTHQLERTWLGNTNEATPRKAEERFMNWLERNPNLLANI
jgi:hypothetical protein